MKKGIILSTWDFKDGSKVLARCHAHTRNEAKKIFEDAGLSMDELNNEVRKVHRHMRPYDIEISK